MGNQERRRPEGPDETKTRHDVVEPGRDAPERDTEPGGETGDDDEAGGDGIT